MQLAGFEGLTFAVLVPALAYACWNDYRLRLIPNWLTAAVAATGLAAQTLWLGVPGLQSVWAVYVSYVDIGVRRCQHWEWSKGSICSLVQPRRFSLAFDSG